MPPYISQQKSTSRLKRPSSRLSTKARTITLAADRFNKYLEHDGVLDMLAYREKAGLLDQDAQESYQKHVKAIYQVGDKL